MVLFNYARANKACTGRWGFCRIFEYFSGFEFFLLPNRVHARLPASNANRWAHNAQHFERRFATKRQELALLLGVTVILTFISISYLRQYLYLVMGALTLFGIANTIYFFLTTRLTHRAQSAFVFGTLSALSLFLSWYLWKKPLSTISIWLIGGLLLGTLLGVSILHLVRIKKQR